MMGDATTHRRALVLHGEPAQTAKEAAALVAALEPGRVLWISDHPYGGLPHATHRDVRKHLGQSVDAVVVDLHDLLSADVLGQCHGLIRGGGALIFRMPPPGKAPSRHGAALTLPPYGPLDVTDRFWRRLERCLERHKTPDNGPVRPGDIQKTVGSAQQRLVAERLAACLSSSAPTTSTLMADRGRGKSSALGMALREVLRRAPHLKLAVTASDARSAAEIFRFLRPDDPKGAQRDHYIAPTDLLGADPVDILVVDEAAALSLPLLQRLTLRFGGAHLAFATTTHGYEGTGRGFSLRFVPWLQTQRANVAALTLETPIRWGAGDRLEALINDALVLDAEPAAVSGDGDGGLRQSVALDREALAHDEGLLRQFFGLLVQAHYRTSPGDLHRMLDAPNIGLYATLQGSNVVAACLVAREGGLSVAQCERLAQGKERIRGHALADTLISHTGHTQAGTLKMIRSVRIAAHPALRRRGLASALVEHVHRSERPDLFGTLFGATARVVGFRRALGYALARVGTSRGARTGEPSVAMLRPVSPKALALVQTLRAELARDLPTQLELMEKDGPLPLPPPLHRAILDALVDEPAPMSLEVAARVVYSVAFGPRHFESAPLAVRTFIQAYPEALEGLSERQKTLLLRRAVAFDDWATVAAAADMGTLPATMRALRRALQAFYRAAVPGDWPHDKA